MNNTKKIICLAFVTATFAACTSSQEGEKDTNTTKEDTVAVDSAKTGSSKLLSVPSPFQIAASLQSLGLPYKEELLSSYKKASSYTTEQAKAMNLGIYVIDMGYAVQNDQGQTALNYLSAASSLANELRVTSGFDKNTLDRFKANATNKDSLMDIVVAKYAVTHTQLQNSDRKQAAYQIFTGAFTEGLYIATNLAKDGKNEKLHNVIAIHKLFLRDLLTLLRSNQDEGMSGIIAELTKLEEIYNKINITYTEKNGINEMNPVTIDNAVLTEIVNQTNAVRKMIVS
jgi:hypothetical protein